MLGADRLAHVLKERGGRHCYVTAHRLGGRSLIAGDAHRTKRRLNLDRLPGKESLQMAKRAIGVGGGPALFVLMPAPTRDGFNLGNQIRGVRHEDHEPPRAT